MLVPNTIHATGWSLRSRQSRIVIVIVSDFDIFEHTNGIVGEDGRREVQGQQVGGHAEAIETH